MAARKKSASRRSKVKAKPKKARPRAKAKKAKAPKRKVAPKKAAARRQRPAPVASRPARPAVVVEPPPSAALADIDRRIAIVRNNLRDLMEQASGTSGSASEELLSDRIFSQEAELRRLLQERDTLEKSEGR
jgi:hypothetical protein